jgi:signal transduction histidine kinase
MADQICDSAERMARQLDELHKLSRVEDRLDVVEEVQLDALIGEIAHDLDPRIRERRVHLEVVHPLPRVMGSRALLAELFQNLIENAVKYGGKGGPRVRVAAAESCDGSVATTVEDDGPGIPEDQWDKVFQLFRRLSRDQKEEGLGAGLAIVRRIAHVHGGSVTVERGRHLSGARFVVRLPGVQPAAVAGEPEVSATDPSSSEG